MKSWFKHDYAARNDDKVLELRAEHGWEGYGIFWAIIEYMAETGGALNTSRISALSIGIGVPSEQLQTIIKTMVKVGLLTPLKGNKSHHNARLSDHLSTMTELSEKRSEAGQKGARAKHNSGKSLAIAKHLPSKSQAIAKQVSGKPLADKIDKRDKRESRAPAREERSLSNASLLEDPEVAEIADDITANALDFPEALRSWVAHLTGSGRPPSKAKILADLRKLRLIDEPVAAINYSVEGGYAKIFDDFDADPPERETTARGVARHEPPPPYHRLITFDTAGNPVGA